MDKVERNHLNGKNFPPESELKRNEVFQLISCIFKNLFSYA